MYLPNLFNLTEFNIKMFFQLVFSFGLPLCKLLQKEKIDLKAAVYLAEDVINILKNIRLNCDDEFHKLFLLAKVNILYIYLYTYKIIKYLMYFIQQEMSVIIDLD